MLWKPNSIKRWILCVGLFRIRQCCEIKNTLPVSNHSSKGSKILSRTLLSSFIFSAIQACILGAHLIAKQCIAAGVLERKSSRDLFNSFTTNAALPYLLAVCASFCWSVWDSQILNPECDPATDIVPTSSSVSIAECASSFRNNPMAGFIDVHCWDIYSESPSIDQYAGVSKAGVG